MKTGPDTAKVISNIRIYYTMSKEWTEINEPHRQHFASVQIPVPLKEGKGLLNRLLNVCILLRLLLTTHVEVTVRIRGQNTPEPLI
jgi:hypothetical protein